MNKLLSIVFAGLFAVASTAALAQDKKAEPKKEEAKPAATTPAKKEEAKPAAAAPAKKEEAKPAAAPAKKEEAKKKEKKGGC
jgi:type IV secretory pathway VirB10-like protein